MINDLPILSTLISEKKDVKFFGQILSKRLDGDKAQVTIEIDRETFYKLNKMQESHKSYLIVYDREQYYGVVKKLIV